MSIVRRTQLMSAFEGRADIASSATAADLTVPCVAILPSCRQGRGIRASSRPAQSKPARSKNGQGGSCSCCNWATLRQNLLMVARPPRIRTSWFQWICYAGVTPDIRRKKAQGISMHRSQYHRRPLLASAVIVLAISAAFFSIPKSAFADEDGTSFWIPGFFGSLAAVPQQPGWSLTSILYNTNVSASGNAAVAREITIGQFPKLPISVTGSASVHADFTAGFVAPSYVFATPFLGGQRPLPFFLAMAITTHR